MCGTPGPDTPEPLRLAQPVRCLANINPRLLGPAAEGPASQVRDKAVVPPDGFLLPSPLGSGSPPRPPQLLGEIGDASCVPAMAFALTDTDAEVHKAVEVRDTLVMGNDVPGDCGVTRVLNGTLPAMSLGKSHVASVVPHPTGGHLEALHALRQRGG